MVECSPATRAARVRFPDDARLFVNPKSIQNTWQSPKKQVLYYEYFCFLKLPPSCRQFSKKPFNSITLLRIDGSKKIFCKKVLGGAGYRSRYLSHAKRALYHLSYAPVVIVGHWSALVITWVTPSPGSDRHWSPGLNVKRALLLFPLFVSTCTEPVPPCLYHLR